MERKMKIFAVISLLVILAGVATAAAYTSWTQSITWTYTPISTSFSVPNLTTVNYDILGPTTKIETYTVTNNGNVPITVNATATPNSINVVPDFNKDSALIAAGGSTTFTLTLVISGNGSCTVNFVKA